MTVHKTKMWLVAGLLLTTGATVACGQDGHWHDTGVHELQFYSPVDLDFENLPLQRDSGFYFRYDKLNWAVTGERV
ncbi:MAG: hypothetical protein ACR2NM_07970, partial [Bythopirellula sp.]